MLSLSEQMRTDRQGFEEPSFVLELLRTTWPVGSSGSLYSFGFSVEDMHKREKRVRLLLLLGDSRLTCFRSCLV